MTNEKTSLSEIQQKLKVPKGKFNSFGKYKYRTCEDIFEAVKPLLGDMTLTVTDEPVVVGDRYYIKATATLSQAGNSWIAIGYAREPDDKKGMDVSQVTGTASSYSRKIALSGLLCIDDTKDADDDGTGNKQPNPDAEVDRMLAAFQKFGIDPKDEKFYEWLPTYLKLPDHGEWVDVARALKGKKLGEIVKEYKDRFKKSLADNANTVSDNSGSVTVDLGPKQTKKTEPVGEFDEFIQEGWE